jgi:SAM-dependent methyltransferase
MLDPSEELFQQYLRQYTDNDAEFRRVGYEEVQALRLDRLPTWLDRIPKGARILDAGCATGYLLGLLWHAGYHNLAGVEISRQLAEVAHHALPDAVEVAVADIRDYLAETPDESFDLILFHHVLEHIPREHTISLLREFRRVLKPGGYLNIKVPNAAYMLAGYHLFCDFTHVVHFNERSMPQVLEAAGFSTDAIEFVQRPPRLFWSWRRPSRALLRFLNRLRWHLHSLLHKSLCLVTGLHPVSRIFCWELETLVHR